MKKFLTYLEYVLSKSPKASIRRFISFVLLIPYTIGIFIGIFVGLHYQNFNFYVSAILAAGIPIMITFFALTWQHVIEAKNFLKNEKPIEDSPELTDP